MNLSRDWSVNCHPFYLVTALFGLLWMTIGHSHCMIVCCCVSCSSHKQISLGQASSHYIIELVGTSLLSIARSCSVDVCC